VEEDGDRKAKSEEEGCEGIFFEAKTTNEYSEDNGGNDEDGINAGGGLRMLALDGVATMRTGFGFGAGFASAGWTGDDHAFGCDESLEI
jgi:hypothetical protein